jgi:hypothetical protein
MSTHRFKIGQTVFIQSAPHQNLPGGAYVIIQKMPERDGEFEYRVKNMSEPYERVCRESQLRTSP